MNSLPIIDVSAHNGVIDWQKVRGNVEAAVIRLGYRGYSKGTLAYDTRYKENRAACEQWGIPFSLYFFPCSITDEEAMEEANFIIRECAGMNFILPVFLDSEVAETKFGSGRADNLSRADRTRFLKIICDRLQAAGIPAGIYASKSWFTYQLDLSQLHFSIWVAQWGDKLTYTGDYVLWQYTSSGSVPGITVNVDLSRRPVANQTTGETNQESKEEEQDTGSIEQKTVTAEQRTVTASVLNIRAEPSADSADLGDLVKGSVITVDEIRDGFAHFEGWCSTEHLSKPSSIKEFSLKADGEKQLSENFKVEEFRCKDGSDKILIDVDFVNDKLQDIRNHFGAAVTIHSGYRTESYNTKVGGAKSSYHMKGQAFDIVVEGHTPLEVAQYAQTLDINGIIQYNGFVHVDSRQSRYWARNDNGEVTERSGF
ncbi:MAG: DUF882 domain-containing protein [Lachnospiraceae bacterium]|nr:DUF882 domain-containing protein [Lachnospiraceae bacterium]